MVLNESNRVVGKRMLGPECEDSLETSEIKAIGTVDYHGIFSVAILEVRVTANIIVLLRPVVHGCVPETAKLVRADLKSTREQVNASDRNSITRRVVKRY